MTIPPGWYPDPAEPEITKYWNGEQWVVESTEPEPPDETPKSWQAAASADAPVLASPGSRLAARIIDLGLVAIVAAVVNAWFFLQFVDEVAPAVGAAGRRFQSGEFSPVDLPHRAEVLAIIMTFTTVALWLAYEVPALLGSGQTLGKRLLQIKVVRLDSEPLRPGGALLRWGVMGVPLLFPLGCAMLWLLIDGAWCLTDRKVQQCLHDKVARTLVVKQ